MTAHSRRAIVKSPSLPQRGRRSDFSVLGWIVLFVGLAVGCRQQPTETPPPEQLGEISRRPQDRETYKFQTVHFEFDRSAVRRSGKPKLEALAAHFKTILPGMELLVEGHCDERGTPEYNLALGRRRAAAVRDCLVRCGIDPARLHILSLGKEYPMALGHDERTWALNRRAEFLIILPSGSSFLPYLPYPALAPAAPSR